MKGARLTSVRGAYCVYRAADCTQSDEQRSSGGMHRQSNAAGLRQRLPSPGPAWAAHRAGSFFAEGFSGAVDGFGDGGTNSVRIGIPRWRGWYCEHGTPV